MACHTSIRNSKLSPLRKDCISGEATPHSLTKWWSVLLGRNIEVCIVWFYYNVTNDSQMMKSITFFEVFFLILTTFLKRKDYVRNSKRLLEYFRNNKNKLEKTELLKEFSPSKWNELSDVEKSFHSITKHCYTCDRLPIPLPQVMNFCIIFNIWLIVDIAL